MKEIRLDLKPLMRKAFIMAKKDIAGSQEKQTGSGKRQVGSRRAIFGSKGVEFEKFRDFVPGEDAGRIDWIASFRAKKTLIRIYSEEQNKDILFFLDVSSSMSYASHDKLKNEYAAELVATLSYALADSGDNIGLMMFTDRLSNIIPPAAGKRQFMKIVRELTNPIYYEGPCDFGRAISQLMNYQKRPALVIIISDFLGLKKGWEEIFKTFSSARYEIVGIMVRDPLDDAFPPGHHIGQIVISDPFSKDQILMDPNRIAEKYKKYNEEQLEHIRYMFPMTQSTFIVLHTDEPFVEKLRKVLFRGK